MLHKQGSILIVGDKKNRGVTCIRMIFFLVNKNVVRWRATHAIRRKRTHEGVVRLGLRCWQRDDDVRKGILFRGYTFSIILILSSLSIHLSCQKLHRIEGMANNSIVFFVVRRLINIPARVREKKRRRRRRRRRREEKADPPKKDSSRHPSCSPSFLYPFRATRFYARAEGPIHAGFQCPDATWPQPTRVHSHPNFDTCAYDCHHDC